VSVKYVHSRKLKYYNLLQLTLCRRSKRKLNKTHSSTPPNSANSHLLCIQSATARDLLLGMTLGSVCNTFEGCHQNGRLEKDGLAMSWQCPLAVANSTTLYGIQNVIDPDNLQKFLSRGA